MTTIVDVHDAKTHLPRILEEVAAGAEVVIAKAGKPVARLVPFAPALRPKKLGLLRGRIQIPADFNAPLPSEMQGLFERR